jgi:hypothetical protein
MYTEDLINRLTGSIAIVGPSNAPGNFGEVIDKYDHVIRVHNFEVEKYEEKVGSKTTVICCCGPELEEWAKGFPVITPFQWESREIQSYLSFLAETQKSRGLFEDRMLFAKHNSAETTGLEYPTTGISLLCLFEVLGKQADVFFMDGYKTNYYYRTDSKNTSCHDPAAEQKRIRELTKLTFITEI